MNRWNRLLKNQLGVSAVELIVGVGLAGAAAMGVASLMGNIGGSGNDAELIVEKTEFASSLGVYLNSAFGCTDLQSAVAGNSYTAAEKDLTLDKWKYRGVDIWKSETKFSDKLKEKVFLKKLTAKLETSPATVRLSYLNASGGAVTETLNKSLLKVTAVIEMKKREFTHEYQISVLETGGNLRFCGDNQTLASTCAALNGEFNPITCECKLKETCQTMGSYIDLTCAPRVNGRCDESRGVGTPNPLTSQKSCPAPSQPVSTGADSWDADVPCGKKCDKQQNNSLGYYTCLYCP